MGQEIKGSYTPEPIGYPPMSGMAKRAYEILDALPQAEQFGKKELLKELRCMVELLDVELASRSKSRIELTARKVPPSLEKAFGGSA